MLLTVFLIFPLFLNIILKIFAATDSTPHFLLGCVYMRTELARLRASSPPGWLGKYQIQY